jgi:hypothetical protein
MNTVGNIIYFDNDNEFYEFCVTPKLFVTPFIDRLGNENYYTDFSLSNQYNESINNGIKFVIKDKNSQIYKRKKVSYRTITKDIQNLCAWDGNEIDEID